MITDFVGESFANWLVKSERQGSEATHGKLRVMDREAPRGIRGGGKTRRQHVHEETRHPAGRKSAWRRVCGIRFREKKKKNSEKSGGLPVTGLTDYSHAKSTRQRRGKLTDSGATGGTVRSLGAKTKNFRAASEYLCLRCYSRGNRRGGRRVVQAGKGMY